MNEKDMVVGNTYEIIYDQGPSGVFFKQGEKVVLEGIYSQDGLFKYSNRLVSQSKSKDETWYTSLSNVKPVKTTPSENPSFKVNISKIGDVCSVELEGVLTEKQIASILAIVYN